MVKGKKIEVQGTEILTDTDRPRKYWNDLKKKLQKEGSELSEKIGQLKKGLVR